jgi:polyphosphate glucokinase
VADVVKQLIAALHPDDVVLGGGNVKKLKALPKGCRAGDNANAFLGGFRLWEADRSSRQSPRKKAQPKARKESSRTPVVVRKEPQEWPK